MSREIQQSTDRQALKTLFYRNVDHTKWENFVQSRTRTPVSGGMDAGLVGEGTHFRVYKLQKSRSEGLDLVLKIAKPEFLDDREPAFADKWISNLRRMAALDAPLVPPFEILRAEETLAMVMPFGESTLANAAAHWQPVDDVVAATREILKKNKLEIGDWIQGISRQGLPFIHDFSDLMDF